MAIIAMLKNNLVIRKIRKLKVYEKTIVYSRTCYMGDETVAHHPEIRLIGKWLADCGFQPGQYVDVTVEPNKLIITHSNEEADLKMSNYKEPKTDKIDDPAKNESINKYAQITLC
ncbi:SymE family type I addiction module toxin [Niabella drilacis]|uniref:Toxin SymE, type I toxin-antitoxin system n=1 Tax=Niabella drilacis (strain DSM 25811 / CCM 8410 / CCUG 62505 / LMG 26954 / E90) TaxID=1285928 RepID=A0A1G6WDB6_NIADE|nr:SymE family type I addiction module toxin [Niabella drilacis]SDD63788.1 Toxin SymE, type I toxin-antitoxin system [Niabella drilacis]